MRANLVEAIGAGIAGVNAMVARVLTFARAHPIPYASVGWTAARANAERWAREESPGSMDIRCRITSGGRKPRDSATENRPPRPSLATCEGGSGKGETVR